MHTSEAIAARRKYFNGSNPDDMESKSASGIKGIASTASNYWRLVFAPDGWGRGTPRVDFGYYDSLTGAVNELIALEIKAGIRAQ
jgi:hypothetical protein